MLFQIGSTGTYIHARHDDVDDVVGRGTIDIVHDQHLALADTRLSFAIGLPRGLALSLMVPFRVVSTTIRYEDNAGDVVQLEHPGIHHRDETLDGLGDPMLLGSIGRALAGWRWTARGGVSIPLGRTQPNPFVLGDEGLPHEHIQMGTGTFDPVLALDAMRGWGRWRVDAFALTEQVLYHDGYGYQAGDRYAAGVSLGRAVGRRWTVDGGLAMQAETAEQWTQTPDVTDGNQGRLDLLLDAGASWAASRDVSIDLDVKVPVYERVVGGQLDVPAIVTVGASWSFGAHARVTHPDATGLDVADARAPAPVPGKITIVDYWATWCTACKLVEPRLLAIVRAHGDRVALRRIDETDADDFTAHLPRVAVYDAIGAKVLERSADGDVPGLLEAVRIALGETPAPAAVASRVAIHVTEFGFEPGEVAVPVGMPVTLVFTRDTDATCATEVAIPVGAATIRRALPLHEPVAIEATFPARGTVTYACGMDMLHGTIRVQ
jgi:thiol-disulfide isomerase/thioredoxin